MLHSQDLPTKNLSDMSKVCRTFSLATLQNVFPPDKFWRQGSATPAPTGAAPYVQEFIGESLYRFTVV